MSDVIITNLEKELKEMQIKLGDNYDVDALKLGPNLYFCKGIARHFHNKLSALNPYYLVFGQRYINQGSTLRGATKAKYYDELPESLCSFYGVISPIPYRKNKLTWGDHYVACIYDKVIEPALGKLVPILEYSKEMFGKDNVPYERVDYI